MTEKQLPSWMTKKKEKVKEERSEKRRRAARSVFYCMNEKELVEAAVSYLTHTACEDATLLKDQKVMEEKGNCKMKRKHSTVAAPVMEVLEEQCSDSDDAQNATYVSETDLDLTEVEALPTTTSPQRSEDQGSGPVQDHSGVVNGDLETELRGRHSAVQDDAFQLVREIFFT